MKPLHHPLFLLIGMAALVQTAALAIEPPVDDSPPPAAPQAAPQVAPQAAPKAAVQAAVPFLGIGTCPVPEVLAAHLELKPGEGVVIRAIDPNGPAATAGLAEHDVVTRIAGQPVASHAEVSKEIQRHQPGDEITIDLIHQGKPATKAVTLAPRPDDAEIAAAPPGWNPPDLDNLKLEGMPNDQFKRIREAIDRQLRAMEGGQPGPEPLPGVADPFKDAQKRMAEVEKLMADAAGKAGGIHMRHNATIRLMDGEGNIEMKSVDGGKEVAVTDRNGKEIWSGPWDTPQDKAAAPPDVRARIEKLKLDSTFKGQGLRLQMGMGFGKPAAPPVPNEDAEEPAPDAPDGEPVE